MDIVTHGMMGVIAASPFLADRPVPAALFMIGSVLPDLDAFSRIFGKRAFLVSHQTYSHAIPVILGFAALAGAGLRMAGLDPLAGGTALALGMVFHSLLDVTNTYGIMLLAPFCRRRYCTEWVFFIDSVVVAATLPVAGWVGWSLITTGGAGWKVQAAYGAAMGLYWAAKVGLRRRAARVGPAGSLALLPSALVPWEYLGCVPLGRRVRLYRIDAIRGAIVDDRTVDIHDDEWMERIRDIPEVRVMRELSPAFHVVSVTTGVDGTELRCRDLRTRNFDTRFGELTVELEAGGAVRRLDFHV